MQQSVKPRKNTAEKWYEKLEGVIRLKVYSMLRRC